MPDDIGASLREWALQFMRNKDLLTRTITSIDKNVDGWDMAINTTAGQKFVLVVPDLAEIKPHLPRVGDNAVWAVTLNRHQNVDALVELWPGLIACPKLVVVFVNPSSNTETKWIIMPHVHDRITEKKALKSGLMSLFSMVEEYARV